MDIPKQIFGINAIIIRQFLQLSSFIDEIDGIDVMIEGKQKSWAKLENICRRKKKLKTNRIIFKLIDFANNFLRIFADSSRIVRFSINLLFYRNLLA